MTSRLFSILLLVAVLGVGPAAGQDSTLVLDEIGTHQDTIDAFQPQPYTLRPRILPGTESVRVGSTPLDTTEYRLNAQRGHLWIHRDDLIEGHDSLFATYRTLPYAFESVYRRRAPDTTDDSSGAVAVVENDGAETSGFDPFEGVDIERSGSVSRGLVSGTNRDANFESGLRMQLDGEVADGVSVRALLTDENTPLQPDGTTQRLRDFDRVFLEIGTPQGTARLGDVDVEVDNGRFGRFSRKAQGVAVESVSFGSGLEGGTGKVRAVGAVNRGQYRKQDLDPTDGVQGPYRLSGPNGEEPVVVVAGSERVYLDGERLRRGRTNDYVIDYARGEITFTADRLITDDRRITVEFQRAASPFTRTLVGGEAKMNAWPKENGEARVSVGATVLRRADGGDMETAFDLSRSDSLRLARAGDDRAVQSGAKQVQFDPESPFVQYRRTTVQVPGGGTDTAFVALDEAPGPETEVFRVQFTRVGEGEGRYERAGRSANGVAYEYRGPGRGAYEPVRPLPAPTEQRLLDLTGRVEPLPGVELFGEWAGSLNDQNRFSSRDVANDRGSAYEGGIRLEDTPLTLGSVSLGRLSGQVRRTVREEHFETFNQTRPIEYGRTWNLSRSGSGLPAELEGAGTERLNEARLQIERPSGTQLVGEGGQLDIGSAFDAWRQQGLLVVREGGWPRLDIRTEFVQSTNRVREIDGTWVRQEAAIRQPLLGERLEPRVELERERRRQRALGTDSLTREAFSFVEVRPGLQFTAGDLTATTSVAYRTEDGAAQGNLRDESTSWTVESEVDYNPASAYDVNLKGGYRRRRVTDYFRINEERQETESILLRLKSTAEPMGRAMRLETLYDATTKRTPVLKEVFLRTGPEIGQFVWRDDNDDGLQQVDEFVPETTPNEGNYVRNFIPSDSLESVVDLRARTKITMKPGRLWASASSWWQEWLEEVSTSTVLEVEEKSRTDDVAQIYGLNLGRFRQFGSTLDGQLRMKQQVELFRTRRAYGLDLTWRQNRDFTERASGAERTFRSEWDVAARLRPAPGWTVRLQGTRGVEESRSEAFAEARSFDIRTLELRPGVAYQPVPAVTLDVSGEYTQKRDRLRGRRARVLKLPVEVEWTHAGRLRLTSTVELADVALDGPARGLARFTLTDGRGAGTSMLWGVQGRYVLSDNLEASLTYDGRAPSDAPTIHTLRAKLTATF